MLRKRNTIKLINLNNSALKCVIVSIDLRCEKYTNKLVFIVKCITKNYFNYCQYGAYKIETSSKNNNNFNEKTLQINKI